MVAGFNQIESQVGALQKIAPPSNALGKSSAILNNRQVVPVNLQALEAKSANDVNNILAGLNQTPDLSNIGVSPDVQDFLNNLGNQNGGGWHDPALQAYANGIQGGSDKATSGNGIDWSSLYNVLNNTLGQPSGLIRSSLDKIINDVKGQWNSNPNENLFQKVLDVGNNVLSPTHVGQDIGSTLWDGLKAGASQQMADWKDGQLSWGDVPSFGFLQGMANNWKSGQQLNQDAGINNLIDKTGLNNSLLQNGFTQGVANQKWMDNIPILDALQKGAQGIMNADPNGNSTLKAIAGLGTEAITDPLSYVDGVGLATKAGKLAELGKIDELSKIHGIDGNFNGITDFMNAAGTKIRNDAQAMTEQAQNSTAQSLGKQMGITDPIANVNDFMDKANVALQQKYPNLPKVWQNGLNNLQEQISKSGTPFIKTAESKIQNIENTIKEARATAENGALNKYGLTFHGTNKYIPLGTMKPKILGFINNPLYKSEATLGDNFGHLPQELINSVAKGDGAKASQLKDSVLKYYNVNDLKDLTKTQFGDLADKIGNTDKTVRPVPDATTTSTVVDKMLNKTDFHKQLDEVVAGHVPWKDVQNQLDQIIKQTGDSPTKRSTFGAQMAQMVSDYWKNAPTKNFSKVANARKAESMDWVSKWLGKSDKYQTVKTKIDTMHKYGNEELRNDMSTANNTKRFNKVVDNLENSKYTKVNNAKTSFEHMMDGKLNPFNPRSLRTNDQYLNSMGNHLADAASERVGKTAQHGSTMEQIGKFIKANKITSQDMTDTIYHMEGQAPKSYGSGWQSSDKVKQLSNIIKPMLDKIANEEQKAGVLDKVRQQYFPHIVNHSEEELQAMKDFQDRHPELKGQNEKNKFNQSRTGFQTMADQQDYLDKLSNAMKTTKDPNELQSLQDEFARTRDLFDKNIPTALTSRIREGVRAQSMKAMHGELQKYGMFVKNPKEAPNADMVHLDKSQVKKLGLNANDQNYMHKDVLEGMKKVDEIFTSTGMNKLVRQMNAVTDIFRTGVTTFKLSHYRNNIIGNAINNMAADVKVKDYHQANKLLKSLRSGTLTSDQQAIIDSAYKHNVINGGFISDLMAHGGLHVTDPTSLEKFAGMISNSKLAKTTRSHMERIDDVFRLGNYINGLKKFGSDEKAAAQVRKYLFNYNEMTNADRKMRFAIPFWNWTKRNIPLQLQNLMERPSIALNYERSKQAIDKNQQGADWQKDTGFKLPFMDWYTSVASPTDDLKQFMHPEQFLGSMNPLPKMILESAFNKELYTGNPISYGSKTVQPKDIPAYVAKNFGITGTFSDLLQSFAGTNNKTPAEVVDNYANPMSKINQGRATTK